MLILTQLGFNVSAHKGHDTGSLKDLLSVTAQAILEVRRVGVSSWNVIANC